MARTTNDGSASEQSPAESGDVSHGQATASTNSVANGRSDTAALTDGGQVQTTGTGTAAPNEQYCNNCGAAVGVGAERCPQCGVELQEDGEEPSGRWKAAIIGGLVSFFMGWVPFIGPAIGGVIAGYMRGSDTKESAITGALANVLASIPSMLLVALFLFLGVVGMGTSGGQAGEAALGLVVWLFIFLAGFLYFWGLGAVGGAIGASMTDKRAPK